MEGSVQLRVLVYLPPSPSSSPQQGFRAGLDAFDKSKFVAPSRSPTIIPWISSPLPTEAILYKYQILSITLHKPLLCPDK